MRLLPPLAACLAFAGALRAQTADPIGRPAALAGVIRDTLGRGLPLATVSLRARDLTVVTDDSGHFHLAGIPAGRQAITILRIGFTPVEFETTFAPDSTIVVRITLKAVQTLGEVTVKASAVAARLARTGYFDRRRQGIGSFVPPERIDSIAPSAGAPSTLLRDVRNILVRCPSAAGRCVVTTATNHCLTVFVDGVAHYDSQLDDILSTQLVGAVEVYERPSIVPAEFQGSGRRAAGRATLQRCGAIVVWTKTRIGK